jgi:hypothetical protein
VACEIDNKTIYLYLAPEVHSFVTQPMAQVPPQFALSFGRGMSHLASELTLRWRFGGIALRPDARLIS